MNGDYDTEDVLGILLILERNYLYGIWLDNSWMDDLWSPMSELAERKLVRVNNRSHLTPGCWELTDLGRVEAQKLSEDRPIAKFRKKDMPTAQPAPVAPSEPTQLALF